MWDIGHDRARQVGGVAEGVARRRRTGGRAPLCLQLRPRHELRGVLVASLEPVDKLFPPLLALLALLRLDAPRLLGALLAIQPRGLFLLFEVLRVLLFTLNVELYERGVFFLELRNSRLCFRYLDVVYEVEC